MKDNKRLYSIRMRAERQGAHISGAEGIFEEKDIGKTVLAYAGRALNHSKGPPDSLRLKVDLIQNQPVFIDAMPVFTLESRGPVDARKKAAALLAMAGVSEKAVAECFKVILAGGMRGAALMEAASGRRLEPDKKRGVRVKMLGITKEALRVMGRRLKLKDLRHPRVKDALILASKVASAPGIVAELCISDDPDYTTGYVASASFGYIRLARIKKMGSFEGGRAFFTDGTAKTGDLMDYLEKTPVLVGKISHIGDIITLHELEGRRNNRKSGGKEIHGKKS